jgi:hypothetical protein
MPLHCCARLRFRGEGDYVKRPIEIGKTGFFTFFPRGRRRLEDPEVLGFESEKNRRVKE